MTTILLALVFGSSVGSFGVLSVLALGLTFALGMAEVVYRKPDGSFVGIHNWGIKGSRRVGLTNWPKEVRKHGRPGAQTVFSGATADADADAEYNAIVASAEAAGFVKVEGESSGSGRASNRVDAGDAKLRFAPATQPTDAPKPTGNRK